MPTPGHRRASVIGLLLQAATITCLSAAAGADELPALVHENFEADVDPGVNWVERGFSSVTQANNFSVATEANGNHYLRVESVHSSSGRGIYVRFSPQQCPYLSWRWKISNTISDADIRRRDADDAAAKLYLIFAGPSWWNPLDKRVLVYVWDNAAPIGSVHPNTWLPDQGRMLVLQSGEEKVGQWISERVHIHRDFTRAFQGEAPRRVEALAFLADTDNTSSDGVAGLDAVVIRCEF